MRVELRSPCKVNLILNILGKRPDGFHEVETVMQPVPVFDFITFEKGAVSIELSCNIPELPVDSSNLVHRAAAAFLGAAGISGGVRIHLEKRIPLAAGLGGGSGNAATTLLGLNQVFGSPLNAAQLDDLARGLGSDVPFFLQEKPALGTGRGERVSAVEPFPALKGFHILLIHPGFGISTPWAYKNLARFPKGLNGEPGRAERLIGALQRSLSDALPDFYNSLEFPVLEKYPLLSLYQEFLRENGAAVALMSGSGSTTFALIESAARSQEIQERFRTTFGTSAWMTSVPLAS
jgi:4-diphosphocytidyl-2-C-methyl-D-erythritol kinase